MRSANFVLRISILVKDGYKVFFSASSFIEGNIHARIENSKEVYLGVGKTLEDALACALRHKEGNS